MKINVQELSGKVLLVTFPEGGSEDSRKLFSSQLQEEGFKIIWMVG